MYEIDPTRTDLLAEFEANPGGPHSHELAQVVMSLRVLPFEDRHIILCTKRGTEWAVGRMPTERGAPVALLEGAVFDDYYDAVRKVFRLRWDAATGGAAG